MESKNIRSKVLLLIIFFSISLFSIAQTKENDKSLLLGEWIWQEASIADDKQPMGFDLDNAYYKFYAKINAKEAIAILKDSEEKIQEIKYEFNGNYLGIELPTGESYIAEWAILEDKLYMEFSVFHPYDTSRKVNLLLVYKKNHENK